MNTAFRCLFRTKAGWIDLLGLILYWRFSTRHSPALLYFSERHGYRKYVRLGRLVVGLDRRRS